jgi:type II secretory pathway component PulF
MIDLLSLSDNFVDYFDFTFVVHVFICVLYMRALHRETRFRFDTRLLQVQVPSKMRYRVGSCVLSRDEHILQNRTFLTIRA